MKRILFILALTLASCTPEVEQPEYHWSAVELLRNQRREELGQWDKLILAISYTESRWNPDAVGSNHDSGHLQLTGPYLSEINRIYKTDYTLEDAFDPETAIKLFTMMQEHYNKEHDIQSAIYHHNKAGYYRDAVMENMVLVERYEAIRKILIEYEHK